jgi:HrpA-like RNA helicase
LTLKERSEPELKRIPLEEVCLHVLSSGNDRNCREFLAMTPQPPSDDAILAALNRLRAIGAVSTDNGVNHEVLTPLGRMLSKMPLDPRLGKMVRL